MPKRSHDSEAAVHLLLDLEAAAGRPAGRISDAHGRTVEFSGWLDLMDALDGVLAQELRGGQGPRGRERQRER